MYKVLIISIIFFVGCQNVGCQKESSSNIKNSEIESSIIDIELKDSILVGNNIFDISYIFLEGDRTGPVKYLSIK